MSDVFHLAVILLHLCFWAGIGVYTTPRKSEMFVRRLIRIYSIIFFSSGILWLYITYVIKP